MQTKEDLMLLGFNENEAIILSDLIINPILSEECFIDNSIYFDLSISGLCELIVTFKNVALNVEFTEEDSAFCFNCCSINKNENKYILTGFNDFDALMDKENPVQIMVFESVEIKAKSLKSTIDMGFNETPWDSLVNFAYDIREKINRPYLTANEKETALYPLLDDLCALNSLYEELHNVQFDVLKTYLPIDNKLHRLLEKFKNSNSFEKSYKAQKRLYLYMTSEKFESSWRNIYNLLEESQSDYEDISNIEIYNKLEEEHNYIDKIMHQYGFDGCYPSYQKETKIKGIHILKNRFDKYNLVCNQSAVIFIECKDYLSKNGSIALKRTTFIGKSSKDMDKISLFFNKSGKCCFGAEFINYKIDKAVNIHYDEGAEHIPSIVCKEADLKKFSKEEKKVLEIGLSKNDFIFSISLGMIIGLIAGVFIFLAFTLLEFLFVLFFGNISDFPQLFIETPWLKLFLFAWLGGGTLIAFIMLIKCYNPRT